jgi:hypothetical protein
MIKGGLFLQEILIFHEHNTNIMYQLGLNTFHRISVGNVLIVKKKEVFRIIEK